MRFPRRVAALAAFAAVLAQGEARAQTVVSGPIAFGAGISVSGTGVVAVTGYTAPGNWTPNDASGAGLALTVHSARWGKIGDICVLDFDISYPSTSDTHNAILGGVPSVCTATHTQSGVITPNAGGSLTFGIAVIDWDATNELSIFSSASGRVQNATISGGEIRGTFAFLAD
jgi:hypothetical protein